MSPHRIKIAGHLIGNDCDPFIVAEAGINHNGEIEKALEMVRVAKAAGAHAIKFQTFKAEEIVTGPEQVYTYKSQGKTVTESMLSMFKRCELTRDAWFKIKKKCDEEKILFLSTPQNRPDLDLLLELGIPAIKVGSDDFVNLPLLKDFSKTGLPMILSCGMADLNEVRETLETVGALDGYPTILLVCTSQYPTPPGDVNLKKFQTLSGAFPMVPLGFSDHTQGPLASSLAVAFGACVFEKHFTLDHDLPGPDHWFSEDPPRLKEWVESVQTAYAMMGSPTVHPTAQEKENKKEFQRVVVAARKIRRGEVYDERNLVMRRKAGGKGLAPAFYSKLLGKPCQKDYEQGEAVEF